MRIAIILICLVFAGLAFAGSCPSGATDCFLCGGKGGIPCTTNCMGKWSEAAQAYVSCECPQGGPCVCYCPVEGEGAVAGVGEGSVAEALGRLTYFDGDVYVRMPGGEWAKVKSTVPLSERLMIKTGKNSKATILIEDGSKIYVDEETEFEMKELKRPQTRSTIDVLIELAKGAIFSDVTKRGGAKFEVGTSVSVPGVKGTKFAVYYDNVAEEATVKVVEGTVAVPDNFGHSVDLEAGQMVTVTQKSGLGKVKNFDKDAEERRWSSPAGGCSSAFALPLALGAVLAVARRS